MKSLFTLMLLSVLSFAINPAMLPLKGVKVVHIYSNGKKENITIERQSPKECLNIPINVENFQSGNLASKNLNEKCKKSFITVKGTIQPLQIHEKIKTVAELEVLDFIETKSKKGPENYVLIDSRTKSWFDKGTIPSAKNVPYSDLKYDEDFKEDYIKAYEKFGVKFIDEDKLDFSKAKHLLMFCNGSWCSQSPKAIIRLINAGYPKEKILWYRGGIAAWAGVALTLTKDIKELK